MQTTFHCPTCGSDLSVERLDDQGIVHCVCGERIVHADESYGDQVVALTCVDEIPLDEYLGG